MTSVGADEVTPRYDAKSSLWARHCCNRVFFFQLLRVSLDSLPCILLGVFESTVTPLTEAALHNAMHPSMGPSHRLEHVFVIIVLTVHPPCLVRIHLPIPSGCNS